MTKITVTVSQDQKKEEKGSRINNMTTTCWPYEQYILETPLSSLIFLNI